MRYPEGIPKSILEAASEEYFREAVSRKLLEDQDHATYPKDGWPWPWKDSATTDYTYAFDQDKTWISSFGDDWLTYQETTDGSREFIMPDMSNIQNVALGKRSGMIIIGG